MGRTLAETVWDAHVVRLLGGLDDISLTRQHAEAITEYEQGRRSALPVTRRQAIPPSPKEEAHQ